MTLNYNYTLHWPSPWNGWWTHHKFFLLSISCTLIDICWLALGTWHGRASIKNLDSTLLPWTFVENRPHHLDILIPACHHFPLQISNSWILPCNNHNKNNNLATMKKMSLPSTTQERRKSNDGGPLWGCFFLGWLKKVQAFLRGDVIVRTQEAIWFDGVKDRRDKTSQI